MGSVSAYNAALVAALGVHLLSAEWYRWDREEVAF